MRNLDSSILNPGDLATCTKPRIYDSQSGVYYHFLDDSLFLICEAPSRRVDTDFVILCPNGAKVKIHQFWLTKFVEAERLLNDFESG